MGKQKGQYFVGRIGNKSYYLWKGIPCMRTIPDKVFQCVEVKSNTATNVLSTRLAAAFRRLFEPALPFPKSFDMQTRFRGAVRNWLKYNNQSSQPPKMLPYLDQFSFNEAASLTPIRKLRMVLTQPKGDELELQVPAFIPSATIDAPARVTAFQMTIIAGCCDLKTTLPISKAETILTIPYTRNAQPAHDIPLSLQMPSSSLTLVVVSLEFFRAGPGDILVTDERWQSAQLVGGVARVGD